MDIRKNDNGIEAVKGGNYYHIDKGSLSIIATDVNCAFYSGGRLVFNASYSSAMYDGKKYKSNLELAKAIAKRSTSKRRFF